VTRLCDALAEQGLQRSRLCPRPPAGALCVGVDDDPIRRQHHLDHQHACDTTGAPRRPSIFVGEAEERAVEERSRCDRLVAETLVANTRAAHLEGELTALRSRLAPWVAALAAGELRITHNRAEEGCTEFGT
jgi:hypothetical protein